MHFRLLGSLSRRPFTTHSETRLEVGWSLCSMVGKWNTLAACSFLSNGKRQRLFFPVSNYTSSFSLLGLVDASPYFFLHPSSPFVFSSFLSPRALVFSLTPSSLIPRFSHFPTPGIIISTAIFPCFDFSSPPCRRAHVLRSFRYRKGFCRTSPFTIALHLMRAHTRSSHALPFFLFGSLLFYAGHRHALSRGRLYFRSDVASLGLKFITVKLINFLAMRVAFELPSVSLSLFSSPSGISYSAQALL